MDVDEDMSEPPVKKERLDYMDMVNYEMPVQFELPETEDVDVDPLMPLETNHGAGKTVQPSGREPVAETEIKMEVAEDGIAGVTMKISSAILDFEWPKEENDKCGETSAMEASEVEFKGITIEEVVGMQQSSGLRQSAEKIPRLDASPKSRVDLPQLSQSKPGSCQEPAVLETQQLQPSMLMAQLNAPPMSRVYSPVQQLQANPGSGLESIVPVHKPQPSLLIAQLKSAMSSQAQQAQATTPGNQDPIVAVLKPQSIQQLPTIAHLNALPKSGVSSPAQLPQGKSVSRQEPIVAAVQPSLLNSQLSAALKKPFLLLSSEKDALPILEPLPVNQLLKHSFLSGYWSFEQKRRILALSRPKPNMDTLNTKSDELIYDQLPWVCGCQYTKKFFCWPCLLFHNDVWCVPAPLCIDDFFEECNAHASSEAHQASDAKLLLQNPTILPTLASKEPSSNPDAVRRNRKLLILLVQTICFMRRANEDTRTDDFVECFSHIVMSNKELLDALGAFQGSSSLQSSSNFVTKFAPLVEEAIEKLVKSTISDDLKYAQFVTLLLEDMSAIVDTSSIAVIAHFVDVDGNVQQRTIKLIELGHDRSANTVFTLFQNIIYDNGLRMKLAGFTYSATVVHPSEISAFNLGVERLCPKAKFFHYQGHSVMRLIFGALSHLNESCRTFFQTIPELLEFFKKHLSSAFYYIESSADFDDCFMTTMKRHYSSVLETFTRIEEHPEDWGSEITFQAPILTSFLRNPTTRFLIVLIAQIYLILSDVTEALQGKIDPAAWKQLIGQSIKRLVVFKRSGCVAIYEMALSPVKEGTGNIPQELVDIFNEITETAMVFLRQRFDSDDFGYIDLESVAMQYYSRVNLKPQEIDKFRSQIKILASEPMLKGKSLPDALKSFYDYNLTLAVPEYATFLDFAMTIPTSNTSLHCPAVQRVQGYQRKHLSKPSPKDLIWMEKELLTNILKQKILISRVIDIVAGNEKAEGFSYENDDDDVVCID